jgi:hypothetical protein
VDALSRAKASLERSLDEAEDNTDSFLSFEIFMVLLQLILQLAYCL